jgi:hypothetical protein
MAKAQRVRGIHPGRSLRENAAKVVALRLEEVLQWRPALEDPTLVTELHNMRIAAKRLRYAFETFQACFPGSKGILKDLTEIQENLGDIHDLDVLTDVLRSRMRALEQPLEERTIEIMGSTATQGDKSAAIRRASGEQARDVRRIGLLGLLGDKINDRHSRYADFQRRWAGEGFADLAGRVTMAVAPPDGHVRSDDAPQPSPTTEGAQDSHLTVDSS